MVEIIKNFKYGIVFAMICTCLQSYGLYEYGAGLTYTHPIGYTFLFAVLFFWGMVLYQCCKQFFCSGYVSFYFVFDDFKNVKNNRFIVMAIFW